MKQGRTLQELGRELQRQRNNRQDFLADTRSLEMVSNSYGSTVHLSLDGKTYGFGVNEVASHQNSIRSYICVQKIFFFFGKQGFKIFNYFFSVRAFKRNVGIH